MLTRFYANGMVQAHVGTLVLQYPQFRLHLYNSRRVLMIHDDIIHPIRNFQYELVKWLDAEDRHGKRPQTNTSTCACLRHVCVTVFRVVLPVRQR